MPANTNDVNIDVPGSNALDSSSLDSRSLANVLFLDFMKSSPFYSLSVWFLWFAIGLILLLVTLALDSPQIIFTLYGCGAFIILMSFTLFMNG
jgi:hypothetical protein